MFDLHLWPFWAPFYYLNSHELLLGNPFHVATPYLNWSVNKYIGKRDQKKETMSVASELEVTLGWARIRPACNS